MNRNIFSKLYSFRKIDHDLTVELSKRIQLIIYILIFKLQSAYLDLYYTLALIIFLRDNHLGHLTAHLPIEDNSRRILKEHLTKTKSYCFFGTIYKFSHFMSKWKYNFEKFKILFQFLNFNFKSTFPLKLFYYFSIFHRQNKAV